MIFYIEIPIAKYLWSSWSRVHSTTILLLINEYLKILIGLKVNTINIKDSNNINMLLQP